jgi:hypothetical protein
MPVSVFSRYADRPLVKAPGVGGGPAVTSLALRLPEETEPFPDSIIHTVIGDETLDMLSQRYYGREELWWRIMDANDLNSSLGPDEATNNDETPETDGDELDSQFKVTTDEPRLFRLRPGDQLIIPPVRAATRFPRR